MSVQNYETDVLQEHTDSTPILVARLDQWRHSVHVVQQYIQGYYHLHANISSNLEKTLKQINDIPSFPSSPASSSNATASGESQLSSVFRGLQSNVNLLLQRSAATTNGIKSSVLPSLDEVASEIEKHYKTLRNQGTKGIKEVEKCREHTQKLIEHLGQVTSSFGTRALSTHEDPLILHRKVEAAVAEQVARENTQAEAALNVQQSFAALESHVIQTIRHSLTSLATLNEGFDKSESEVNATITQLFKNIDMNKEWNLFAKSNADNLVPSKNYQRDPKNVTFVNKTHPSTKPVLQGILQRKGTVLKSYNQGYYVISPTGYLYQFKSAEPTQETSPELSLYLPGCQVSKSSKVGQYVFKIVGKDSNKAISARHKYSFKTGSAGELEAWYTAVARMTGNENAADDDSGEGDSVPQSPVEPPTAQMADSSISGRTAQQPVQQTQPVQATTHTVQPQQAQPAQHVQYAQQPQATQQSVPASQAESVPISQPLSSGSGPSGTDTRAATQAAQNYTPHAESATSAVPQSGRPHTQIPEATAPSDLNSAAHNTASSNDPFKGF